VTASGRLKVGGGFAKRKDALPNIRVKSKCSLRSDLFQGSKEIRYGGVWIPGKGGKFLFDYPPLYPKGTDCSLTGVKRRERETGHSIEFRLGALTQRPQ
jgi:hypothetical protein